MNVLEWLSLSCSSTKQKYQWLIAVLASHLIISLPVKADPPVTYRVAFTIPMPPMGGSSNPSPSPGYVVSDKDGNVYVSEPCSYKEFKYSPKGALLATWGGKNSAHGPYGLTVIAVDHSNQLYAIRPDGEGVWQILRMDTSGKVLGVLHTYRTSPALLGPGTTLGVAGIAFDSHDNIYVLDSLNSRIIVFRPNGTFWHFFGPSEQGSTGGALSGNGGVAEPTSIVIDAEDNVIFSDHDYLAMVQVLDRNGKFVRSWGRPEQAKPGYVARVGPMAQDHLGRLFIAGGDRFIQIADKEGRLLGQFGMQPVPDEHHEFTPVTLTVTPDGKVWVCDVSGRQVVVFAPVVDPKPIRHK